MTEERERIEQLHRRDVAAARSGDYRALRLLVSDDAVVMAPGGDFLAGKAAIDASFAAMANAAAGEEILDYRMSFTDVTIVDRYAFEHGTISGSSRLADGTIEHSAHKVLRVLRKEDDGAWRIFRTMWNDLSA